MLPNWLETQLDALGVIPPALSSTDGPQSEETPKAPYVAWVPTYDGEEPPF